MMLCKNPYMAGATPFGCGQCLPCRINKRRLWQNRQFFEAMCHEDNSFVTLTYHPDHCPTEVQPETLQLFLKRLRRAISPSCKIRFFAIGEYGNQSNRPHYHLSIFGAGPFTQVGREMFPDIVERTWGHGFVLVAEFNEQTAGYVTKYVTKAMTRPDDARLAGRHPEFFRVSNRPGLGALAMIRVAQTLINTGHGMELIEETGDVPHFLMSGKRKIPLGRYLLRKLREQMGFTDDYVQKVKDSIAHSRSEELLALFSSALASSEAFTFRDSFQKHIAGAVASVETRHKIFAQKDTL